VDSFEWNKVFAAVIAGALLIMVLSTVSEGLFPEYHGGTEGFPVEVAEATSTAGAVVEEGPSLAELLAAGDVGKGERAFAACKACHTVDKGGRNATGPNLYGVLGRAIGSVDGFGYSSGLSSHGGNWDFAALDNWLTNPKKMVSDSKMIVRTSKANKRADLIVYLNAQSDNPLPLPEIVAAVEEAAGEAVDAVTEAVEGAGGE
jgi:cytochrome c